MIEINFIKNGKNRKPSFNAVGYLIDYTYNIKMIASITMSPEISLPTICAHLTAR